MTPPSPNVEQIARKLSKATKRAILKLSGDRFTDWNQVYRQRRQRIAGHALGLHEPKREGPVTMWCSIRLTPLGLAVRAFIQGERNG